MADKSKIEWTDSSWNPIAGCSVISPGCTNCYAMKMAARIEAMAIGQTTKNGAPGLAPTHYAGTTKGSKAGAVWTGKLTLAPEDVLLKPLRWKRPRMIFVNSMSDLFHESVPDEWIDQVFAVMALCPQHTFQVLTKRAERMRAYISHISEPGFGARDRIDNVVLNWRLDLCRTEVQRSGRLDVVNDGYDACERWPLPNVWLGVSAEDQKRADERIPHLLETPAAVRFVSAEPLLGPINLQRISLGASDAVFYGHPEIKHAAFFMDATRGVNSGAIPALDWIIVGGESGPNARPMHPDWARSIRDQCQAAGVPYFFKQWGEWIGVFDVKDEMNPNDCRYGEWHGENEPFIDSCLCGPGHGTVFRVGKRAAGRLLDGREHNEMPERAS